MTAKFWIRRIPVWPFHAWAIAAAVLGGVFVTVWWPERYPGEGDLVKFSGPVATVSLRDDILGTQAGGILQGWTSTYFTLEGIEGEFRYPRSHPKNVIVRDRTGVALDVWVARGAIGGAEPMVIWQIREHNPYKNDMKKYLGPETFVSHAEIVDRLTQVNRSMIETGAGLLAAALALFLLGLGATRWNSHCASKVS